MEDWLPFLGQWVELPLATIAVFEGVRRLPLSRPFSGSFALLVLGLAVLLGHAAFLGWQSSSISTALLVVDAETPPRPSASALAAMAPGEREEKTRLLAKVEFERSGALVRYESTNGQQILYAPSEQEIHERQATHVALVQARLRLDFIRAQGWIFLLATVAALGAGVCARFFAGQALRD